ncbi:phosphatidylcholine transfer protein isoform X1 [Desmodus rotundus]|uniref:phosphatidylcholine transfer protein isoform X1 n=1 Tax=Desmodus rotundus TaxID=9430 RepID=UPI002380F99F|nr:phosphatidylcholine transfer protein isoform X1 [Desmodus rotundus]
MKQKQLLQNSAFGKLDLVKQCVAFHCALWMSRIVTCPLKPRCLCAPPLGCLITISKSKQTGLYEYKVFGVLEDCPPAVLADVYMDLDYRKQWDQYVKELYEKECGGKTVVYWEVKYPFPMSNRDYVYIRQRQELDVEGRKIYVVLAQSVSIPQFAERPGVVRVKGYKQSLAIESDGKKGSKVFMYYFDNPGGQIPSWLINWAAKNGVPNFLKDMEKACQAYLKKT